MTVMRDGHAEPLALAIPILAAFDRSNARLGVRRHIQYALDLCAMREIVTSKDTDHRAK